MITAAEHLGLTHDFALSDSGRALHFSISITLAVSSNGAHVHADDDYAVARAAPGRLNQGAEPVINYTP
jgi:hypothetical protein